MTSGSGDGNKSLKKWVPKCYGCHGLGHYKKDCKNLKKHDSKKSQENTAFQGQSIFSCSEGSDNEWIADLGATQPMTMNKPLFYTYEEFVQVRNGQSMKALGKDIIHGVMVVDGKPKKSYLKDVWFGKKLFSITSVLDKGYYSVLNREFWSLYKDGTLCVQPKRTNGLLYHGYKSGTCQFSRKLCCG